MCLTNSIPWLRPQAHWSPRPRTSVSRTLKISIAYVASPRMRPVHFKAQREKASLTTPVLRATAAKGPIARKQRQLLPAGRYDYPCICTPVTKLFYYSGTLLTAVHPVPTYVAELCSRLCAFGLYLAPLRAAAAASNIHAAEFHMLWRRDM